MYESCDNSTNLSIEFVSSVLDRMEGIYGMGNVPCLVLCGEARDGRDQSDQRAARASRCFAVNAVYSPFFGFAEVSTPFSERVHFSSTYSTQMAGLDISPERRQPVPGLLILGRRRRSGWCVLNQQGDARLRFVVEQKVDGIEPRQVEFQLLKGDDEIARAEMRIAGQHDFGRQVDAGHDGTAVSVDEIEPQFVLALVLVTEGDAQGNGALRVRGGDLLRDDGVESTEKVELAVLLGGGIAQDSDLDIHRRQVT